MPVRFDVGTFKATKMSNGWLRAPASLTRAGVFEYRNPDGTVRRELRPPEEVAKTDSLATLEMVPVTLRHPPALLNASNTKQYSIGSAGSAVHFDTASLLVNGELLITDAAGVNGAETGKSRELSCAYECREDHTPGVWQGQPYDLIQRDIKYNHVALEPMGRAGSDVRIHLDAADAWQVEEEIKTNSATPARETQTMKIRLDGVDFDVNDQAAQAIQVHQTKLEEALKASQSTASTIKSDLDKLQAKMDAATELTTKLQADLKAAQDPLKVKDAIKARVELERKAASVLEPETKLDAMEDMSIMTAVVKKLSPAFDATGKSPDYIRARFDAAIEVSADAGQRNDALGALRGQPPSAKPPKDGRQPGWRNDAWKNQSQKNS